MDRTLFQHKAAAQKIYHLAYGDGFFVNLQDGFRLGAAENLLKRTYQVNDVGGELGLGALRVNKVFQRRIGQRRIFDLLLLEQHLGGSFELLVLQ